jgi:hypothetical protein
MAQWYYAQDQKQSGPVTWEKLRELASSGVLEKNDMVWRDGMAEWQKATTVEGLFAKTAVSAGVSAGMPVGAGASGVSRRSDSAGRMSGERALADRASPERPTVERRRDLDRDRDRDDVDDDSPSGPRRKKKKKKDEGMSPGAMAGLIGGCIAGGLVVVIIIIVLLVRTGSRRAANQPAPPMPVNVPNAANGANAANVAGAGAVQPNSYEVTLGEGQQNLRSFQFQQGQRVTINVNTRGGFIERPDVDLYVSRAGDAAFNAVDISLSEHCFVSFIAPATDQYTLRLENLGPGGATSTVTIR